MTEPKARKRALTTYTNPEFEPYLLALGHVTLAWNDLQEQLAQVFWALLSHSPVAFAVWHSSRSDRAQRAMIEAAVKCYSEASEPFAKNVAPKIEWLLGKADYLEIARNDAIHSPLESMITGSANGLVTMVLPTTGQDNPRAVSLDRRKDLLAEFYWVRDTAIALSDYGYWIMVALGERSPLPDTPSLPNRGLKPAS